MFLSHLKLQNRFLVEKLQISDGFLNQVEQPINYIHGKFIYHLK